MTRLRRHQRGRSKGQPSSELLAGVRPQGFSGLILLRPVTPESQTDTLWGFLPFRSPSALTSFCSDLHAPVTMSTWWGFTQPPRPLRLPSDFRQRLLDSSAGPQQLGLALQRGGRSDL